MRSLGAGTINTLLRLSVGAAYMDHIDEINLGIRQDIELMWIGKWLP